MNSPARRRWALSCVAVAYAAILAYAWAYLDRGWVPHDAGTLGQTAERILGGELPHRDFHDVYTGGLAALNAFAFRLFGVEVFSMRLPLFAAFALWIPAVYYVSRRFVGVVTSVAVALLAAAWSIPNYPGPIPSWYNLFLATAGIAAGLRYLETEHRRWLFAAGLAGGVSVTFKIVGLYFLGAFFLFVLACPSRDESTAPREAGSGVAATLLAFGSAFLVPMVPLVALLAPRAGPQELYQFVLPSAAACGLAALFVHREASRGIGAWLRGVVPRLAPFAAGAILPVAVFLLPYLLTGSVGDLLHGIFGRPLRRFGRASVRGPALVYLLVSLLPAVLLAVAAGRRGWTRWSVPVLLAPLFGWVLLRAGDDVGAYLSGWYLLRGLVPVAVLGAALILNRRMGDPASSERSLGVLLLVLAAAFQNLVQFPFAGPIYLFYALPLAALCGVGALSLVEDGGWRPTFHVLVAFFLLFSGAWIHRGFIWYMGSHYEAYAPLTELDLPRGGIRVPEQDARLYELLVDVIHERTDRRHIYAGPDSPEVYFLAEKANPTPTLFDFLDEPEGRTERILRALEETGVEVVVLNRHAGFSGPPPRALLDSLESRYPQAGTLGPFFFVRWR